MLFCGTLCACAASMPCRGAERARGGPAVSGSTARRYPKILKHSVPLDTAGRSRRHGRSLTRSFRSSTRSFEADRALPKKQRHTAQRIFERLRDEYGFSGGITIVTDYIREKKRRTREVFSCPCRIRRATPRSISARPSARLAGVQRKLHYFAMAFPHSDAFFIKAYPAETTEAFLRRARLGLRLLPVGCRCRSSMTIPPSRWRRSWAMGPASAPAPLLGTAVALSLRGPVWPPVQGQ